MTAGRDYPTLGSELITEENNGQADLPFVRNTKQVLQEEAQALINTPPPQMVAQKLLAIPEGQPPKDYGAAPHT